MQQQFDRDPVGVEVIEYQMKMKLAAAFVRPEKWKSIKNEMKALAAAYGLLFISSVHLYWRLDSVLWREERNIYS